MMTEYCTLIVEAIGSLRLAQESAEHDVVSPVGCAGRVLLKLLR